MLQGPKVHVITNRAQFGFSALGGLAETEQPTVRAEAVLEPAEVQIPPLAIPNEIRHAAVAKAATPDSAREDQDVFPKLFRNFVLVLQQVLRVALAEIGFEIAPCTTNHIFTADIALTVP